MEGFYFRDRWQASTEAHADARPALGILPAHELRALRHGALRSGRGNVLVGGLGSVPNDTGISAGKKQFAPRVGFAYRVSNKTVVRGGYGISIDPQGPAAQMLFSYPLVVLQTFAGNTAYIPFGPIANGIPPIRTRTSRPERCRCRWRSRPSACPEATTSAAISSPSISLCSGNCRTALSGRLAYVGTHTLHENLLFNINAANPGAGNSGRPLAVTSGRTVDRDVHRALGIAILQRAPGATGSQLFQRPAGEGLVHVLQDDQQRRQRTGLAAVLRCGQFHPQPRSRRLRPDA